MCTATWLIHRDGFELYFNRDESVRRGAAHAPEILELDGVRCLAPRDADAGGTWLGVNEHGLAVGLLNAWDGLEPARPEPGELLCSSSLERARAQEVRAGVLARLAGSRPPTGETLEHFQRSHEPARGPWSPCMHREDASTVSASQVRVLRSTVAMRYAAGPPCTTEFGPWLELERRRP